MTFTADFKTKQLMKRLSGIWDRMEPVERKKYKNDFAIFVEHSLKDKAFSDSDKAELMTLLVKWHGFPENKQDFSDFETFFHYMVNV